MGNPAQRLAQYDRDVEVRKIIEGDGYRADPKVENGGANAKLIDHESNADAPETQEEERSPAELESGHVINEEAIKLEIPGKERPTFRKGVFPFKLFRRKQDLLEHLASEFRDADQAVSLRRRGRMRPTEVAFVTFETVSGAQIASQVSVLLVLTDFAHHQVVHYPQPSAMFTSLAPEPRVSLL